MSSSALCPCMPLREGPATTTPRPHCTALPSSTLRPRVDARCPPFTSSSSPHLRLLKCDLNHPACAAGCRRSNLTPASHNKSCTFLAPASLAPLQIYMWGILIGGRYPAFFPNFVTDEKSLEICACSFFIFNSIPFCFATLLADVFFLGRPLCIAAHFTQGH